MTEATSRPQPLSRALMLLFAAWALPGLGHAFLGRRARAALFFVVVLTALIIGTRLEGNLPFVLSGQPLTILATLGCMGVGLSYFFLQMVAGYHGAVDAVGYEYGTAFILSAGLMNLLLILDVWDISQGQKS